MSNQYQLTHGSLFSGIGGFELAAEWAGIKTLWNCEIEPFQLSVLKNRFNGAKQYTNIKGLTNPGYVDIITGGFPCQDISIAGKGVGIIGERSGLWSEMWRIIRDVRPKYVIIENSPMLAFRGFERVLCDLSKIGYDAEWQCLSGTTFGVQQGRERLYCIAYTHEIGSKRVEQKSVFRQPYISGQLPGVYPGWRTRRDVPQPRSFRSIADIPGGLDRIGAVGNVVMPLVALYLFECIKKHFYNI